jgi:ketosteroid isomerase-like protein
MTTLTATITRWVDAMNAQDREGYIGYFTTDAVLDDPSVGEQFAGTSGILEYFDRYFIGYNTTTRIVSVTSERDLVHVVVDFTGDFPGAQTGGVFDVRFSGELISHVYADLI